MIKKVLLYMLIIEDHALLDLFGTKDMFEQITESSIDYLPLYFCFPWIPNLSSGQEVHMSAGGSKETWVGGKANWFVAESKLEQSLQSQESCSTIYSSFHLNKKTFNYQVLAVFFFSYKPEGNCCIVHHFYPNVSKSGPDFLGTG